MLYGGLEHVEIPCWIGGGGAKMFYFLEDHVMRSPKMSEKMKMLAVQTLHFPAEEQNIKMTGSNR